MNPAAYIRKLALGSVVVCSICQSSRVAGVDREPSTPLSSPRDYFNAGTQKLSQGKLPEAESLFETALASQDEKLQPPTLYNLGHVRFSQGVAELKKGPAAGPASARGDDACKQATDAIDAADAALAGNDIPTLVGAYVRGRGARKELRAAAEAVRRAMDAYGVVLGKWERASGDFKSAVELKSADADAFHNADVVDRCIARLIDSLREMRKCAGCMSENGRKLQEKLKQLKGRIPGSELPGGGGGDDDDDMDEVQIGMKPGQKEAPSKDGREIELTPEQAGWLLKGFRLDNDRRLPMTQTSQGLPKDRSRSPW